jgi:hypothetical protein
LRKVDLGLKFRDKTAIIEDACHQTALAHYRRSNE